MEGEDVQVIDVGAEQGGDNGEATNDSSTEELGNGGNESVSGESEQRPEGNENQEADKGDGRKIAQAVRSHLAELKKANPSLAKELERIYWKGQGVDKLGTLQELTALKEAVELHG